MRRDAIDLKAALDTLPSSLTEAGWEVPQCMPSSLSLSLSTWDRVLSVVACVVALIVDFCTRPDVLADPVYTFALSISDAISSVVSD